MSTSTAALAITPATPTAHTALRPRSRPQTNQEFLSFRIGTQEYGVDLQHVQEIRSYQAPTRIANAPGAVRGVLNLRGAIVPVIDLRTLLGIAEPGFDAMTITVVLNLDKHVFGLVVDAVNDVVQVKAADLRPLPGADAALTSLVEQLAALDARMLLLLRLQGVLQAAGLLPAAKTLPH